MDKHFTYLVEKFLDNNLSETEKTKFEKYLENPACADYLEKAKRIDKIIEQGFKSLLAEKDINEILNEDEDVISAEIEEDILKYGGKVNAVFSEELKVVHRKMLKRRKTIRLLSYGSVAAAALIGLVFFFTLYLNTSPQELYKKYNKPYEFIALRNLPETGQLYYKASITYMSGNYSGSARLCRETLAAETLMPEVHFLYGLNLMGLDSMQGAIQQFNAIDSLSMAKDIYLFVSVHWYESLCYLQMGKVDSALFELGMIKGTEDGFLKGIEVEGLKRGIERLK